MADETETKPAAALTREGKYKYVFTGSRVRAQLAVFDFSGSPVEKWRAELPKFYVSVLPVGAHRNTAFSTGRLLYGGTNFADAVTAVRKAVGAGVKIPARLAEKYGRLVMILA